MRIATRPARMVLRTDWFARSRPVSANRSRRLQRLDCNAFVIKFKEIVLIILHRKDEGFAMIAEPLSRAIFYALGSGLQPDSTVIE